MKPIKIIVFILQLVSIAILIPAAWDKLSGGEMSVGLFSLLEMEPYGRYIIGFLEISSALLLLVDKWAATGAFLALAIMIGALIAHGTRIGFEFPQTGYMLVLFTTSFIVCFFRKRQLPFIGDSLR